MSEKKEEKRVTSIARKINLNNVLELIWSYLIIDILICLVVAAVAVYGLDV